MSSLTFPRLYRPESVSRPSVATSNTDVASLPPPPLLERAYRGAKEVMWALSSAEQIRRFMPTAEALADRVAMSTDPNGKAVSARHIYGAAVSGHVLSKVVGRPLDMQQAIRLATKTTLSIMLIDHVLDEAPSISSQAKRSLLSNLQGALLYGEKHEGVGQTGVALALAREVSDELRSLPRFNVFAEQAESLAHRVLEQTLSNTRSLAGAVSVGAHSLGLLAAIPIVLADAPSIHTLNAARHFGALLEISDDLQDAESDERRGRQTFATDLLSHSAHPFGNQLVRRTFFNHARKCFGLLQEPERDGYRFLWRVLKHQWSLFSAVDANAINPPCRSTGEKVPSDPLRTTTPHGYYWGPLFIQPRIGKGGADILVYKLRTMRAFGKDEERPDLDVETGKALFTGRVTPSGRLLRRYFIDEIPQAANLALGQLQLVGIRPMQRGEYERLDPKTQAHYSKYGPAAMSISYAFNGRPTIDDPDCRIQRAAFIENFYQEFSARPRWTTIKYAFRIAKSIVIDGKRGL